RLASLRNTGDRGSSNVYAPYVITPIEGLKEYLGESAVVLAGDENDPIAAARIAAEADAAIVVVGCTADDEGEYIPSDMSGGDAVMSRDTERRSGRATGGDRDNLGLVSDQVAMIRAIAAANRRTIVVVIAGSAVMMNEWIDRVPAVVQTFYSGMEGG